MSKCMDVNPHKLRYFGRMREISSYLNISILQFGVEVDMIRIKPREKCLNSNCIRIRPFRIRLSIVTVSGSDSQLYMYPDSTLKSNLIRILPLNKPLNFFSQYEIHVQFIFVIGCWDKSRIQIQPKISGSKTLLTCIIKMYFPV